MLELDPVNVKALYRRAQAHMGLADFFEAEQVRTEEELSRRWARVRRRRQGCTYRSSKPNANVMGVGKATCGRRGAQFGRCQLRESTQDEEEEEEEEGSNVQHPDMPPPVCTLRRCAFLPSPPHP